MLKYFLALFALIAALGGFRDLALAQSADKGRVLVVLSSAHELTLRDGKHYPTGFYLDEFGLATNPFSPTPRAMPRLGTGIPPLRNISAAARKPSRIRSISSQGWTG
jgi:hypothetical protein